MVLSKDPTFLNQPRSLQDNFSGVKTYPGLYQSRTEQLILK